MDIKTLFGLSSILIGLFSTVYTMYNRKKILKSKWDTIKWVGFVIVCLLLGLQFIYGS